VMNEPQNITIDAAPATMFLSANSVMGASREIWFLPSGFLYEVDDPAVARLLAPATHGDLAVHLAAPNTGTSPHPIPSLPRQ